MSRDQRGAATAELAMAVPLLVGVTLGLVWLLSVGVAQLRIVDAAREAARAVARGDTTTEAVHRGVAVAPPGSRIRVTSAGEDVVVTADGSVGGPGGLFGFLPAVHLHARAVAPAEAGP